MAKLTKEQIVAIATLAQTGEPILKIARRLQVDESTVRYHLHRIASGATDGRAKDSRIDEMQLGEAIQNWWRLAVEQLPGNRSPNVCDLYDWLVAEHRYDASLKSVRKWVRTHIQKPPLRPFRRIETPPAAQAQADWSEHREIECGAGPTKLWIFHLTLSHSRRQADIPCLGCDQLWWHHAHLEAFRRLGGVPAAVRIDNLKTGMSEGAGVWGTVNPAYQSFATQLGFHVDPCPVRRPQAKGKVERGVQLITESALRRMAPLGLTALQGWLDQQADRRDQRRRCPATGTSVHDAWQRERPLLRPLPDPCPEPFDIAVTRVVGKDCMVCFEGHQYTVPFIHSGLPVEVRGCAGVVQIIDPIRGTVLRSYQRHTAERVVIDPTCFEGEGDDRVAPPLPLGAMGKKLVELGSDGVQRRAIDLYAALAAVVEARS